MQHCFKRTVKALPTLHGSASDRGLSCVCHFSVAPQTCTWRFNCHQLLTRESNIFRGENSIRIGFVPFWKVVYSFRREFTPRGNKYFPNRVDPFSKGDWCAVKYNCDRPGVTVACNRHVIVLVARNSDINCDSCWQQAYNCDHCLQKAYNCDCCLQQAYNFDRCLQQAYNCDRCLQQAHNYDRCLQQACKCGRCLQQAYNCDQCSH